MLRKKRIELRPETFIRHFLNCLRLADARHPPCRETLAALEQSCACGATDLPQLGQLRNMVS